PSRPTAASAPRRARRLPARRARRRARRPSSPTARPRPPAPARCAAARPRCTEWRVQGRPWRSPDRERLLLLLLQPLLQVVDVLPTLLEAHVGHDPLLQRDVGADAVDHHLA